MKHEPQALAAGMRRAGPARAGPGRAWRIGEGCADAGLVPREMGGRAAALSGRGPCRPFSESGWSGSVTETRTRFRAMEFRDCTRRRCPRNLERSARSDGLRARRRRARTRPRGGARYVRGAAAQRARLGPARAGRVRACCGRAPVAERRPHLVYSMPVPGRQGEEQAGSACCCPRE